MSYYNIYILSLSNFFFTPPTHLCAVTYDWNIVDCDVKQPIHLTFPH